MTRRTYISQIPSPGRHLALNAAAAAAVALPLGIPLDVIGVICSTVLRCLAVGKNKSQRAEVDAIALQAPPWEGTLRWAEHGCTWRSSGTSAC
jgi:hypothetical protein